MVNYKSIIIIGSTNLIYLCSEKIKKYYPDLSINIYDTNKINVSDILNNVNEKTLVFSIMNKILLTSNIINNELLTTINLHHSLLPKHPGRNAEAWAIFEEDDYSGITWHYVDTGVDTGDIIFQSKTEISEDTTSLALLRSLNNLALEALDMFLPIENFDKQHIKKQEYDSNRKVHKSYDIPNDGFLDLSWSTKKINRFINSINYGILKVLGAPKMNLDGKVFSFSILEITPLFNEIQDFRIDFENSCIYINQKQNGIILKKIKLEEEA